MRLKNYIGDRAFYKMLLVILLPLIVQQGVTNFVNLLDNLMVGRLGTAPMSSVAIANQMVFVFNLMIFGAVSGGSIFGAQYAGAGDHDGARFVFRFKMLLCGGITLSVIALFLFFGKNLAMLFLDNAQNRALGLDLSLLASDVQLYLSVMCVGLVPFAAVQVYSSTLREFGNTFVPMLASVIAIFVNLIFNWILIFGRLGFPPFGITGAAFATVLSRYVELAVVLVYTHRNTDKFRFAKGAYASLYVPEKLVRGIIVKGFPLMLNETLWSFAITFINGCYASRGLAAVAATNITATAWNLFCVVMFAMGTAISIIVGRALGRGDRDLALDRARKLFAVMLCAHLLLAVALVVSARFIPLLYNTEPNVRSMATEMLVFAGLALPIHSIAHASYFTIRSGGRTGVTFLFDCVYSMAFTAPLAYILCRFTALDVVAVYAIIQFSEAIKATVGLLLVKSGAWARTLI